MAMVAWKKRDNGLARKHSKTGAEDSLKRLANRPHRFILLHRLRLNGQVEESSGALGELVERSKNWCAVGVMRDNNLYRSKSFC